MAGSSSRTRARAAATWIADGNVSLLDCEALTWSFGWTGRPSRSVARRGEHLVGVHVRRGAGTGLEDVDRELVGMPTVGDLGGRGRDGLRDVVRDHAELGVDLRGRPLDRGQGGDQAGVDADAADREVLHRPLRLRPPLGGRGDPYLTHRVVLDPELSLSSVMTRG